MPRAKWRTVATDHSRTHASQPAAYRWVATQPDGAQYRIEKDDNGRWVWFSSVRSVAGDPGFEEI